MALRIKTQIGASAGITSEGYLRINNTNLRVIGDNYTIDGSASLWLSEKDRDDPNIPETRSDKIPNYFSFTFPDDTDINKNNIALAYGLVSADLKEKEIETEDIFDDVKKSKKK